MNLYKRIYFCCFVLFLIAACFSKGLGQVNGYNELIWSDEFDAEGEPDARYWNYDIGTGSQGWGNWEVQHYTRNEENVRVSEGKLIIDAIKSNNRWTSARIKTQGQFNFQYGRIEFRAKIPKGSGTWPALWLLGENITSVGWPACGEIDVMEHVGRDHGWVHASLHTPASHGATQNTRKVQIADVSEKFYVYAAEWTPDHIRFFIDDRLYYTFAPGNKNASTYPFNSPFFIIMNVALGGNFGSDPKFETGGMKNGIDPALTKATMEVDYVRVYQKFENLQISGESFISGKTPSYIYKANNLSNASYEWTVPEGAEIISGQGTYEVKVKWNNKEGDLRLKMTYNDENFEKVFPVKKITEPTGSNYKLEDFSAVVLDRWSSQNGSFDFEKVDNSIKVNFNVENPGKLPGIFYTMDRPVDMTEHPVLKLGMKSFPTNGVLVARIDLEDLNGKITSNHTALDINPVINDGEYFTYQINVSPFFGKGNHQVDGSRITRIRILINHGFFGRIGAGSLHINDLQISQTLAPEPPRPSGLTIYRQSAEDIKLSWRNNATDHDGFRLYISESAGVSFDILKNDIGAGASEVVVTLPDPSVKYYFKLTAFNEVGESAFSNMISTDDIITSIAYRDLSAQVKVFPNPATEHFFITGHQFMRRSDVKMFDLSGKNIDVEVINEGGHVKVRPVAAGLVPGVYFLRISGGDDLVVMRKLIIKNM